MPRGGAGTPDLRVTGPARARATLLLAHGAGAPMDSPFLETIASLLAERRIRVVRFEFPYMAGRRSGGLRRPPDPMPRLEEAFRSAVRRSRARRDRLWIGGKSLGGRVATRVADEVRCAGVVVLGYPFHPPRAPERLRVAHLTDLATPCLILQGERDPFGTPEEARGFGLAPGVGVVPVPGGDHSFEPLRRSGRTTADNLAFAADRIADWLCGGTP